MEGNKFISARPSRNSLREIRILEALFLKKQESRLINQAANALKLVPTAGGGMIGIADCATIRLR